MNKSTTDTPRTDAASFSSRDPLELMKIQLKIGQEKVDELRASKAEVEFWKSKAYEAEHQEGLHEAEVERLRAINADMRNFLAKAIHNKGFNEEQALKFIYQ